MGLSLVSSLSSFSFSTTRLRFATEMTSDGVIFSYMAGVSFYFRFVSTSGRRVTFGFPDPFPQLKQRRMRLGWCDFFSSSCGIDDGHLSLTYGTFTEHCGGVAPERGCEKFDIRKVKKFHALFHQRHEL